MKAQRTAKKFPPLDAGGKKIKSGDTVKVIGMPEFSGKGAAEFRAVFSFLVGKNRKVSGFDEYGCLELLFRIRQGRRYLAKGVYVVALEPHFTRLLKRRKG